MRELIVATALATTLATPAALAATATVQPESQAEQGVQPRMGQVKRLKAIPR